jgi:hypothetical protein
MRHTIVAMLLAGLLTGCAADLVKEGNFEPLGDGRFKFRTYGDGAFPESSAESERLRTEALTSILEQNSMCPNGHEVTERKAILKKTGIFGGQVHDIYYYGRCT